MRSLQNGEVRETENEEGEFRNSPSGRFAGLSEFLGEADVAIIEGHDLQLAGEPFQKEVRPLTHLRSEPTDQQDGGCARFTDSRQETTSYNRAAASLPRPRSHHGRPIRLRPLFRWSCLTRFGLPDGGLRQRNIAHQALLGRRSFRLSSTEEPGITDQNSRMSRDGMRLIWQSFCQYQES